MFEEHSEVPQTRSGNPQRNRNGGPNGIRTRVSALRGPCPGPLDDGAVWRTVRRRRQRKLAGGGGFEPPLPGPEPGVLPLDDPPPTRRRLHTIREGAIGVNGRASADRDLERAARAEARNLGGRDLDGVAVAGGAHIAGGAAGHHEGAEA